MTTFDKITEDLRKSWTLKLYHRYRMIAEDHKLRLRPATIKIEDLQSIWGEYSSLHNSIRLNARLFTEYSWDTVIEVLKHEMIHQYLHEHELHQGAPHGQSFKEMARRLGLSAWATAATIDIPRDPFRVASELCSDEEERLLKKAEKLLALAESSSEHEAALAMQRVRDLYEKYNLHKYQTQKQGDFHSAIITRKKRRIEAVDSLIFSVLMEFFFVEVLATDVYDHFEDTYYRGAEIIGKLENIKLAEYVYHFLWNQADMRAKKLTHNKKTGMLRRDFRYGLINGFAAKLREQNNDRKKAVEELQLENISQLNALITAASQELKNHVHRRFPYIETYSIGNGRAMNASAYHAGFSEGQSLNLHKGIHQKNSAFGGYLK